MSAAPTLREWLREAPFALTMSSGFFGFFAHTGMLSVLDDEGLAPTRVSGSSAGALVTGTWASGVSMDRMRRELLELRREHFWDPRPGFGLLRGKLFRERLRGIVGDARLESCRVPITVSVFDVWRRNTRVLDRGDVATALTASCAVPFLFQPVWIESRPYLDGGVLDRPGIQGLPDNTRVLYHHLASRSPWRLKSSPQLRIPARAGLTALVIEKLPRLGPFRLERASEAFDTAARATREALGRSVDGNAVRI
jgi:NTE family protein